MKQLERTLAAAGNLLVEDSAASAAARTALLASEAGLIDIAYAILDSPFGPLLVATTAKGLVRLAYSQDPDLVLEELALKISPRVLEAPERVGSIRRDLDEYFEGRRRKFEFAIDWRLSPGFYRRVLQAAARIPYGEVATYKEVAARAGNPRATRAAGNALGSNPIAIVVPCHRVLRTGGGLGGYGGGLDKKVALLHLEGALP